MFNQEFGKTGTPKIEDEVWRRWRREQVTQLVQKTHDVAALLRPKAKLSASVLLSRPDQAATDLLQEWGRWTRDKLLDFVIPMLYMAGSAIGLEAKEALKSPSDRHVYIGIGAYLISPSLAQEQVLEVRAAGAPGMVFFSYHVLTSDSAFPDCVKIGHLATVFPEATATPTMPWKE